MTKNVCPPLPPKLKVLVTPDSQCGYFFDAYLRLIFQAKRRWNASKCMLQMFLSYFITMGTEPKVRGCYTSKQSVIGPIRADSWDIPLEIFVYVGLEIFEEEMFPFSEVRKYFTGNRSPVFSRIRTSPSMPEGVKLSPVVRISSVRLLIPYRSYILVIACMA